MASGIWLRVYGSGHMLPGIRLWAYGSGHVALGIWLRASGARHGSGRAQETVRVQRLVVHNLYVGDPTVPKPVCAQLLVNGEVHRCVLHIAICYEHVVCATFAGKLAVTFVHVQRLVNRGLCLTHTPTLKLCCG